MQPQHLDALHHVYRDGLLNDTLPFWIPRAIDRECGRYLTAFDRDGRLLQTDKPVWFQGRFAWLLATLYNTAERRQEWLDLARHGIEFLNKHCFDSDGRMYFSVKTVGPGGEFYDTFDGRLVCPGHAIEAGWFILEEARLRGNDPRLVRLGTTIVDWSLESGWDERFGDILYHRDGTVSTPLNGNMWKGPFHLPRMQWYCMQRLDEMRGTTPGANA